MAFVEFNVCFLKRFFKTNTNPGKRNTNPIIAEKK